MTAWLSCLETPSSPTAFLEFPVQAAWCSYQCSEVSWASWHLPSWRALFRFPLSAFNSYDLPWEKTSVWQEILGLWNQCHCWRAPLFFELITAMIRPQNPILECGCSSGGCWQKPHLTWILAACFTWTSSGFIFSSVSPSMMLSWPWPGHCLC